MGWPFRAAFVSTAVAHCGRFQAFLYKLHMQSHCCLKNAARQLSDQATPKPFWNTDRTRLDRVESLDRLDEYQQGTRSSATAHYPRFQPCHNQNMATHVIQCVFINRKCNGLLLILVLTVVSAANALSHIFTINICGSTEASKPKKSIKFENQSF